MKAIERAMGAPPPIDEARPCRCPVCRAVPEIGGRVLLHGNGSRRRQVVLPDHRVPLQRARLVEVYVRRFVCTACGVAFTVLPSGLLPRRVYSLFAIVAAWWLALAVPYGEGLAEVEVYARQGVDRLDGAPELHRTGRRRWRSLARWAGRIEQWWTGRAIVGSTWRERATSLLIGLGAQSGEACLPGVLDRAWSSHAGRGAVM